MNRTTAVAAVWILISGLYALTQYPMSDTTNLLIAGASGAIISAYMLFYVFRSQGTTYLLRSLPLFAVVGVCLYFVITGGTFFGMDAIFKGFVGFSVGMIVSSVVHRLWPK